jgi:shikimate kinase
MSEAGKRTNLFLTGMMGSGKSSLGRLAAIDLGYSFVDTDAVVQDRCSMTIAEIFAEKGEDFFRQQEDKLLREIIERDQQVVATGGGMFVSAQNRDIAASAGLVVYLHAPVEVLASRVGSDSTRPLIGNQAPSERLAEIFEQRRHAYEEIPVRIDTHRQSLKQTADKIVELYREWRNS